VPSAIIAIPTGWPRRSRDPPPHQLPNCIERAPEEREPELVADRRVGLAEHQAEEGERALSVRPPELKIVEVHNPQEPADADED
jgi:hypothetical protein